MIFGMSGRALIRYFATFPLLVCLLTACGSPGGSDGGGTSSIFPLRVSSNGRTLVDLSGAPFLVIGDAPQALMVNVSPADAELLLADRASRGFNTVWIMLLADDYCGGRSDGSTFDGLKPFRIPGDLATPNETYFARCDEVLRSAAAHNLLVILDPIETGGFLPILRANGSAKARAYGRYLGNRYKDFDNIIWMSGSDFQTWQDATDNAVVKAVASGIREADPRHIQTLQLNYYVSNSLDDGSWSDLVSLNAAYTYYPTYAEVLAGYRHAPAVPVFLIEADYEQENGADAERLRRQEYWSLLSGACGHVYGNEFVWPLADGWKDHLGSTGAVQFGYCRALFKPRPWQSLVPDESHALVTAHYGTYSSTGTPHDSISENTYVTAAMTEDGKLGIIYIPTARTITVDLGRFSGPVTARWYDPTTGIYEDAAGSPFPNSGSQDFTSPGVHADGASDWVLVLETS